LYLVNEPKDDEKLLLGYIKKKDFEKLEGKTAFYFHASDKQNNFIGFPYALYDAASIVLYEGGRSKPFTITEFYAPIKAIHHKHKTAIAGKENSKTEYYFELELEEPFSIKDTINTKVSFKKLAKKYKADFDLTQSYYSPIVVNENDLIV